MRWRSPPSSKLCRRIVWREFGDHCELTRCNGTIHRAYIRVGDDSKWRAHWVAWGLNCESCGHVRPDTPQAHPAT